MLTYLKATCGAHDHNADMISLIVMIRQIQLIAELRVNGLNRNYKAE